MLNFDRVDAKLFRAFVSAADTQSFTAAAQKSGMTQSGMSQHIAKLEAQLGVSLFERINKKVLLTPSGDALRKFIDSYNETLGEFIDGLTLESSRPRGLVRYAMPSSCLKTPHFPRLLEMRKKFQEVNLQITLLANREILEKLLNGEIDFGFVTERDQNPALIYKVFAEEEYVLVAKAVGSVREVTSKTVETIPYVSYPGFGALFDIWRKYFFPKRETVSESVLPIAGSINDLDGALTMVRYGVGVSVIPSHCAAPFIKSGELRILKPEGGRANPVGTIYLVHRSGLPPLKRVQVVMESFWKMKA